MPYYTKDSKRDPNFDNRPQRAHRDIRGVTDIQNALAAMLDAAMFDASGVVRTGYCRPAGASINLQDWHVNAP